MLSEEVEDIRQILIINPIDNYLFVQKKALQDQIQKDALEQELYWAQRSHQKLIQVRDRNTKYFHIMATNRKRKNSI